MSQFEPARLTVRLGALAANYRECVRRAGAAQVAGVVKADGYGLGMAQVARALAGQGCGTFFVARLSEGMALRSAIPRARIFVLDGAPETAIPALIVHNLTPTLNSLAEISAWSKAGAGLDAAIHIDTGMNRLGLPADEFATLAGEAPTRLKHIRIALIMSHLACADDAASSMNATQLSRFRAVLARLPPAPASLASSGGVMLGKDYMFDMVRPGIGLYGGNPQSEKPNVFATVAVLTARILQLRCVDKGETVGYAATFRAMRPSTLATVALGYADGLKRVLGNRGFGAVKGVRAPIAGRVSMDLVTLDVTDVPGVMVGDEVEFLGDTILLDDLADAANTVAYEILTSLGPRIPRRYEDAV